MHCACVVEAVEGVAYVLPFWFFVVWVLFFVVVDDRFDVAVFVVVWGCVLYYLSE